MTDLNQLQPPPLPGTKSAGLNQRSKVFLGLMMVVMSAFVALRVFGLVRPFKVPTGAMAPTIAPGDHLMMEGFSFLSRKPRRGDVVVFKTDGIPALPPGSIYVERVVGGPGEHVRISVGKLYIDDKRVVLSNAVGEIAYILPPGAERMSTQTDVIVPAGQYYVLGDNSTNSSDSRFWGFVPANNILGRIAICYWPPQRVGAVK